ncbi:MAG: serine/threonine protein kinase [Deltaproteobacteria bacterium]|nr:serine/threonine protein kinase [Deltaproteobacteria bacterium]
MTDRGSDGGAVTLEQLGPLDELRDGAELAPFETAGDDARYLEGRMLGAGGMGEVRSFVDRATGRSIAMKTVRKGADALALRRFAREARIQSQLEHPSIVPVYDVGLDGTGAPYITMKHVRGQSLASVITKLRAGDDATVRRFSQRKLLTVLSSVAMTVEYAHRRGVIHRDLKPDNIMLGPFDEVYVLDWGLAAIVAEAEPVVRISAQIAAVPDPDERASQPLVDSSPRPETATGSLLGTPGYLAPELLEGGRVATPSSDVYALGAILYEVLVWEPMNRGESVAQKLGQALDLDGPSPRERAVAAGREDVAPELDALAQLATRRDPAMRLDTAAGFQRAIERYLDGDRDTAQRRELAARSVDAAAAAVASPDATLAQRSAALHEVTKALGLDPTNAQARTLLVRLMTQPPREAMRIAEEVGREARVRNFRFAARSFMFAQASYVLYLPLLLAMGIRNWWMMLFGTVMIVGVLLMTIYYHRRPPRDLDVPIPHLVTSLFALLSGEVLFGPLVLVPTIVVATGVGYLASFQRGRVPIIVGCLAVIFVPVALQLAGVIPASYEFADGRISIVPMMTELPALPTMILLVASHAITLTVALLFVARLRRSYVEAESALRLQAWHLGQLVPEEARPAVP